MAREREYRQNDREPSQNWWARTMGQLTGLATLGAVAYKMGGPVGGMLQRLKQNRAQNMAQKSLDQWNEIPVTAEHAEDLLPKIDSEIGEIRPAALATEDDLKESFANLYNRSGLTDTGTINTIGHLEGDIESLFSGKLPEHDIKSFRKLRIFESHEFNNTGIGPAKSKEIVVTKLRLEALREFMQNTGSYSPGAPDLDLSDLSILEDPMSKNKDIYDMHKFYMENNKIYANRYHKKVKRVVRDLRSSLSGNISRPGVDLQGNAKPHNISALQVPSELSSLDDMFRGLMPQMVVKPNKNQTLYESMTSKYMSKEVVERRLGGSSISKAIKEYGLGPNRQAISRLANQLERLKLKNEVTSVGMEFVSYGSGKGDSNYLLVKIGMEGSDKIPPIVLPISKDGMTPNLTSINGRKFAHTNYVVASPFREIDAKLIDSNEHYINQLTRILDTSMMNELNTDPVKGVQKIQNVINKMQQGGSAVNFEIRDYAKINQVKLLHHEQIHNSTIGSEKSRIANLKVGHRSLKKMNISKLDNTKILVLDLETLNNLSDSPQHMAYDNRTEIWGAGITVVDPKKGITAMEDIVSDHGLEQLGLTRNGIFAEEEIKALLSENNTSKKAQAMKRDSKFMMRSHGIKGNSKEAMLAGVKAHVEMIQNRSGSNKGAIKNIRNSAHFANEIIKYIRAAKNAAKAAGQDFMILTANGERFDMNVLASHVSPELAKELKNLDDHVDILSMQKALSLGFSETPSGSVGSIFSWYGERHASNPKSLIIDPARGKARPAMAFLNKFFGEQTHVVHEALPSSTSKKFTMKQVMQHIVGKKYMKAHNSALFDTVETLATLYMMKEFHEDIDHTRVEALGSYLDGKGGANMEEQLRYFVELEGMYIPGTKQRFTMNMLSANQQRKGTTSSVSISDMFPFEGLNPLNRQMGQIGRNVMLKKMKGQGAMRHKPFVNSGNVLYTEELFNKYSNYDANLFTNSMNFNTVFSIGTHGAQEQLFSLADDVMDNVTAYKRVDEMIPNIDPDSKIAKDLMDQGREIKQRFMELKKQRGNNTIPTKGESEGHLWNLASEEVMQRRKRVGQLVSLDPNNDVQMNALFGGKKVTLSSQVKGTVVGIKATSSPGALKDGPMRYLLDVAYEAGGKDLAGGAINIYGDKSSINKFGFESRRIAAAKDYNMLGNVEAHANFNFLEKGYVGSLKHLMLNKALVINGRRLNDKNIPLADRKKAEANLEAIATSLRTHVKNVSTTDEGGIVIGRKGQIRDQNISIKEMSSIKFQELFDNLSIVGHDAIYNKQTLEQYYNYHGGGDKYRGVHKAKSFVDQYKKELLDSSVTKGTISAMGVEEMNVLMEHMDPMGKIEDQLHAKGIIKNKGKGEFWNLSPRKQDRYLRTMRVPIFAQVGGNVYDGGITQELQFWSPGTDIRFYGVNQEIMAESNVNVKFKKAYMDQIMMKDSPVPESTKHMLMNSIGHSQDPKKYDIAKKMVRARQVMQNNTLSDLAKNTLSLEDINEIANNHTSNQALKKMLTDLNKDIEANHIRLNKIINRLNVTPHNEKAIEIKKRIALRQTNLSSKKSLVEQAINKFTDNRYILHDSFVKRLSKISQDRENILFLPAGGIKKNADKNRRVTFHLENMINAYNEASNDDINAPKFAEMFKELVANSKAQEGFKPHNQLFDIIPNQNKLGVADGTHTISMGGWLMPTNSLNPNIMNKIDDLPGMFGAAEKSTRLAMDSAMAFAAYNEHMIAGNNRGMEIESHTLNQNFIRMMANSLGMDNKSMAFAAEMELDFKGINMMYDQMNTAMDKANGLLRAMDGKDNGFTPQLNEFYKTNSKYSTPKGKTRLRRTLTSISKMKMNDIMINSDMIFKNNQMMSFSDGSRMSIADIKEQGSKQLQEAISEMEQGMRTMPGANTLRNPFTQSGVDALLVGDVLALPGEVMSGLLGRDPTTIGAHMAIGAKIKADSDRDRVQIVLQGFRTIDEMNERYQDGVTARHKMMGLPNYQNSIREFNESLNSIRTFSRGGKQIIESGHIFPDGSLGSVELDANDIKFDIKSKNPIRDKLAQWLNPMLAEQLGFAAGMHSSDKMVQRHIETTALTAWSQSNIGLWTNTLRTRVHELHSKAGLINDPMQLFALTGDLKSGITGVSQMAVAFQKHGSFEDAFKTAKHFEFWNSPDLASKENTQYVFDQWKKQHEGMDVEKQAVEGFELLHKQMSIQAQQKKLDPTWGALSKAETDILFGSKGADIASQLRMNMAGDPDISKRMYQLNEGMKRMRENMMGPEIQKMAGTFDEYQYSRSIAEAILPNLEDPLDKAFRNKWGSKINKINMNGRKGAAVAGITALAYMGMNFFRPNQMSNSANPLDGFIELNHQTDSGTNAIGSQLQLARGIPLNKVDASFSKSAFIEMNKMQSYDKNQSKNLMKKHIEANTIRYNPYVHEFRSERGTQTYTNMTTKIGKFGSNDMNRRSSMI